MKPGAIDRMIELMDGVIYYNFTFTYLGFSGGTKMYSKNDFIPDCIIFLHRLEMN